MFGHDFYHKTLRKYVSLFGTLFNSIYINRVDGNSNNVQTLKIPVTYGPKNKSLMRVDRDPNLNRPAELFVPLLSFEMTGMRYASDRKLITTRKHMIKTNTLNTEQMKWIYNPVPYDIDFSLYLVVKNAEDGTRILEQILPFFTPDWTVSVNLISDLDIKMDIPIIIQSVSSEDTYEGSVGEKRSIIWTLNFTMKGYIFGPSRKSEVIKLANVNFYHSMSSNGTWDDIDIYPGLLANGSPTTNSSLTVNKLIIKENDDWDYIITVTTDIQNE